jgi:hypothetical protein
MLGAPMKSALKAVSILSATALVLASCVTDGPKPPNHHTQIPGPTPTPLMTATPTPSPSPTPDPLSATPTPAPMSTPVANIPYGIPVPGKPGYVFSPYAQDKGYVDVRGIPPNTEVRCPFSGKTFLVP